MNILIQFNINHDLGSTGTILYKNQPDTLPIENLIAHAKKYGFQYSFVDEYHVFLEQIENEMDFDSFIESVNSEVIAHKDSIIEIKNFEINPIIRMN